MLRPTMAHQDEHVTSSLATTAPMYQCYQCPHEMTIVILCPNIGKMGLQVTIEQCRSLAIRLQKVNTTVLEGALFSEIDEEGVSTLILSNKVVLTLPKIDEMIWPSLFGLNEDIEVCPCCGIEDVTATGIRSESSVAPAFLGGGTPRNKAPEVYGQLSHTLRPASADLPEVRSRDAVFASSQVKDEFMKTHSGDCHFEYSINRCCHIESLDNPDLAFSPMIRVMAVSPLQGPLVQVAFPICVDVALYLDQETVPIIHQPVNLLASQSLYSALTLEQREILSGRILHLLLRTCGVVLDETFCDFLFHCLLAEKRKKKIWKEILDLCILNADLGLVHATRSIPLSPRMVKVGEALENVGKFQRTGRLYEEIAAYPNLNALWPSHNPPKQLKFAAIAYVLAKNYDYAEEVYVSALNKELVRTGGSWALNDENTTRLFESMTRMYYEIALDEANKNQCADPVDATMEFTLCALCFAAGIRFESSDNEREYRAMFSALSPRYHKARKARNILKAAVADPISVEKFRTTILACTTEDMSREFDARDKELISPSRAKEKARARRVSKMICEEGIALVRYSVFCSNPSCHKEEKDSKFLCCPCQTVSYVSMERL